MLTAADLRDLLRHAVVGGRVRVRDVALVAGVDRSTVYRWLRGQNLTHPVAFLRALEGCGLRVRVTRPGRPATAQEGGRHDFDAPKRPCPGACRGVPARGARDGRLTGAGEGVPRCPRETEPPAGMGPVGGS